ncbi:hypothetical protein Aam_030_049 [Acidocella aminolytica 101 = DSM 11237]|uniref:Uncharacterized protein n=1 Tax=Acidocella aminolytica 101 = DSM 11237 TaxID=1120923 RepID=A0A0D6PEN2_9PROT|nr:hypothetical protein Aam_030_049 [Acidocella aminolytica 101 = DSM 11237]GBQ34342.1 hypothetical protein AA11237_0721 [Acidocella aminolytica 101 = DSM 11237]
MLNSRQKAHNHERAAAAWVSMYAARRGRRRFYAGAPNRRVVANKSGDKLYHFTKGFTGGCK